MRNRRWYSTELGKSIYTIALDSDTSLAKGSNQLERLNAQLMNLSMTTRFVFIGDGTCGLHTYRGRSSIGI
jgi:hypothetical protein